MVTRRKQLDQEVKDLKRKLSEQKEEFDSEVITLKKKLDKKEEEVGSSKNMLEKLKDKMECPVCLDIPRSGPVPVCPNGHVVCKECKKDICPICRTAMGTNTSLLAGTVLENIEHECKFVDCNENLCLEDLKKHEAVCPNRTVNCPHAKCGLTTPLDSLSYHLKSSKICCGGHHKASENWNYRSYEFGMNAAQTDSATWRMNIYSYSGETFVIFPIKSGGQFYFSMVMFASETECSKYEFEMIVHEKGVEALDSEMSVKFRGTPISIDIKKEEQKLYSTGAELMKKIVKKSNEENTFSVAFKISKKGKK